MMRSIGFSVYNDGWILLSGEVFILFFWGFYYQYVDLANFSLQNYRLKRASPYGSWF